MMIRSLIVGLAIVAPSATIAEVVRVTSGEHAGFTRLVFAVNPSVGWSLQSGNQSAKLIFPTETLTFNESAIFTRIARNRLSATRVAAGENATTFQMDLGCNCEVKAYAYLNNYIVVDIFDSDGPVANTSDEIDENSQRTAPQLWGAQERALAIAPMFSVSSAAPAAPKFYGTTQEDAFPETSFATVLNGDMEHDLAPMISTSSESATDDMHAEEMDLHADANADLHDDEHLDVHSDNSAVEHSMAETDMEFSHDDMSAKAVEIDVELAETVAMARTQLLQQLTMAAEQGLLNFDGPISFDAEEEPVEEVVETEEPVEPHPTQFPIDDRQLRVQSVYNRDGTMDEILDMLSQNTCPDEGLLNIASWGSGEDFSDEMSAARTKMLKEFDEPDLSAVSDLIHVYIRYGFGLEAETYLNDYEQVSDQELLLDLAKITDGRSVSETGPLGMANACDGLAGVMALVGQYPNLDSQSGDVVSIMDAFSILPIDIRRSLGPRLSLAFLGRGLLDEATNVSEIVERAPGEHGDEHALTAADIARDRGDIDTAEDVYESLVHADSAFAVDALIKMAEVTLEQGKPMTREVLADLGAAADIGRGTEKGSELRRLEALWLVELAGAHNALTLLAEEIHRDPLNSAKMEDTIREILLDFSASGNHEVYAKVIDEFSHFAPDGHDGYMLRTKIGAELLTVGLPNMALEILRPDIDTENADGRLIAARANLDMSRPDQTLSLLAAWEGDNVRRLRVEAHLELGDFANALLELDAIEDRELAEIDLAWYQGNWKLAAGTDLAALKILDGYGSDMTMFGDVEFSAETEMTTLADVQNVLDTSNAASDELAAIVAGH